MQAILTRHGIPAHLHADLSRYLTTESPRISPEAARYLNRREFKAAAREWCRAASAEFVRNLFAR